MKKYFFVLLTVLVQITVLSVYPEQIVCLMFLSIGVAFNGLAVLGNHDKMPVVGLSYETPHHRPVDSQTRYLGLIDRHYTTWGTFSIGDILMEIACVTYLIGSGIRLLAYLLAVAGWRLLGWPGR